MAPIVSGLCSLLMAARPGITPAEIQARILRSALQTDGWVEKRGWGRIQPATALTMATPTGPLAPPTNVNVSNGLVSWDPVPGAASYRVYGGATEDAHELIDVTAETSIADPGRRYYRVTAYDQSGEGAPSAAAQPQVAFDLAPAFIEAPLVVASGTAGTTSGAAGSASEVERFAGAAGSASGAAASGAEVGAAAGSAGGTSGAAGTTTAVEPQVAFDLAVAFLPLPDGAPTAAGTAGSGSGATSTATEVETAAGEAGSGSSATGDGREVAAVSGEAGATSTVVGDADGPTQPRYPLHLEVDATDGDLVTVEAQVVGGDTRLTMEHEGGTRADVEGY